MLSGEKILITGVHGAGPFPIAAKLAQDNEVWGLARFGKPEDRARVEAAGIRTVSADLGSGDFADLPSDFTYVLHFAWLRAPLSELETAMRVNVEGAGLLLQHCRKAKAALMVSSQGVYSPNPDPMHLYTETDPIGRAFTAYAPTSPATKLAMEGVARFCARAFDLPVTIARLNTIYGVPKAYHSRMVDAVLAGESWSVPGDPNGHSPIHVEDMADQVEALLGAAGVNALITNWCGDEVIVTQDAAARISELSGKPAILTVKTSPGSPFGNPNDTTRRRSITGPCRHQISQEIDALYEERVEAAAQRAGKPPVVQTLLERIADRGW